MLPNQLNLFEPLEPMDGLEYSPHQAAATSRETAESVAHVTGEPAIRDQQAWREPIEFFEQLELFGHDEG